MRELDKHAARATARVERTAPDSKDTATFMRHARAASLKAIGSKFGALAEEEYDKIAPVIACTLPALTDSIPERKRKELAGEVTRELQVVGNAASIAIRTWVRSNDKSKARAEEREKNIGWIRRMFTAWRVCLRLATATSLHSRPSTPAVCDPGFVVFRYCSHTRASGQK